MPPQKIPATLLRSDSLKVSPSYVHVLKAGIPQSFGGTDQDRKDLLKQVRDGEQVELLMGIKAFRQKDGVSNANFIRFPKKALGKFAKSFVGSPFLKDHSQDLDARGGTVVKSKAAKQVDGESIFEMDVNLTAPWAVEAYLTGNLDRFSIGWDSPGMDTIECSLCKAPILSECFHFPGDLVEIDDETSSRAEWIYTQAEGIEVSAVSVPAVAGTGVESIRQTLSSFRAELAAQSPQPRKATDMNKIAKALGLDSSADEATILASLGAKSAAAAEVLSQLETEKRSHALTTGELTKANKELTDLKASQGKLTSEGLLSKYGDRILSRDEKGEKVDSPMKGVVTELCDKGLFEIAEKTLSALPKINTRETAQALAVSGKTAQDNPKTRALTESPEVNAEIERLAKQQGKSIEYIRKHSDLVS